MIDYTNQVNLSRKINKSDLFKLISKLAQETFDKGGPRWGMFLIVGNFALAAYKLEKYLQLTGNDLEGHVVTYGTKAFKEVFVENRSKNSDGAYVLDSASGQLLGNRVLYIDLKPEVNEERGARHHAAASASIDANVEFVVTVSEESLTTRLYVDGKIESQHEIETEASGPPVEEEVT
jgi:DNA integrity scanning protein DisA with diadenylate cyclase activity